MFPENLGRKVTPFLKKTTDTSDIKANIAILKFDQVGIRAKLQKTSEAWINCIFLVMNLMVLLRELYEKLKKSPRFGLCWLLKKLAVRIGRVLGKILSPVPMAA